SWQQVFAGQGGEVPFRLVDLAPIPAADRIAALERAAAEAQASLDIAHGPILRVVLFDLGAGEPNRLLVIIHHLAVDGVSWRTVLEDLWSAYEQALRGGT